MTFKAHTRFSDLRLIGSNNDFHCIVDYTCVISLSEWYLLCCFHMLPRMYIIVDNNLYSIMFYFMILYYILLYSTLFYYILFFYIILCSVLFYFILFYFMQLYSIVRVAAHKLDE